MRFPTWSIGVLSTLTIFAASTCGSTSSGPSAQQACADLAAARCKQRSTCTAVTGSTGVGASLARVYGDMATCLQREELACKNGLAASQTGNSPTKVEACGKRSPPTQTGEGEGSNPLSRLRGGLGRGQALREPTAAGDDVPRVRARLHQS